MAWPSSLSPALARRIALAAQGFGRPSTGAAPGIRQLDALIDRLGLLQIDSVNVFERSHYLPVVRPPRRATTRRCSTGSPTCAGAYIEYWAHEASFIPVDTLAPVALATCSEYREKSGRRLGRRGCKRTGP